MARQVIPTSSKSSYSTLPTITPFRKRCTMSPQPSNSGIVTDESGERHIPESVRADGSVRKAIKIRPGYRPAEDVQVYKNRTAETFRNRYKGGVIGAEAANDDEIHNNNSNNPTSNSANGAAGSSSSAAANKNAKRREARKKAKAAETDPAGDGGESKEKEEGADEGAPVDSDVERKKKARNLTKKLKQAKELKSKKDDGQSLLPEQFAKVIKINELVRELAALGFDSEGEPIKDSGEEKAGAGAKGEEAPA